MTCHGLCIFQTTVTLFLWHLPFSLYQQPSRVELEQLTGQLQSSDRPDIHHTVLPYIVEVGQRVMLIQKASTAFRLSVHRLEHFGQGEYTALVAFRKHVFELWPQGAIAAVRLAVGIMLPTHGAASSSAQDQ